MRLSSLSPTQLSGAQIALAALLAMVGFVLLLPRPRGRFVPGGISSLIASLAALGVWLYSTFGKPMADAIGTGLFCFFSISALVFGTVLVVQRNPARGAIAFAFVILSTCGLFLLLAAPFLMAATIIIYAGAIIVTFLFVLMLSQVHGPSDENDRSREPWLGALGGFAFTGLVLFAVFLTAGKEGPAQAGETGDEDPHQGGQVLPAPVLTNDERERLSKALVKLDRADDELTDDQATRLNRIAYFEGIKNEIAVVVGSLQPGGPGQLPAPGRLPSRLERPPQAPYRDDAQTHAILERAKLVRETNENAFRAIENHFMEGRPSLHEAKAELQTLREEMLLLTGSGELPARNVSNIGYLLYADHLLAIELAGTLLLVATIGAVAIAKRRGAAP